ncbi:MAG: HEAT repeat domain-containing protein [Coleofasciculus sp. A1-SPW-01]|uniref:HEAT repeat domain-containing protein n=1 Tax=Coleofasciculus sp. A1-SPW-01 TaxID=3070819 RepID=UPI0032F70FCB
MSQQKNSEDILQENSGINPESFERFVKNDKADTNELLKGLKVATVYIDNRSIGNYFEEDARIYGSVSVREHRGYSSNFSKEIVGQILVENLDKIRSVYVETSDYSNVFSTLNNEHILVLWGNPKLGKQTTALRLLSSVTKSEIFEINPAIENINLFEFEFNKAYLIDTLTPDVGEEQKIDNYILKELSQKLKQKNSYLVVTVDSRWNFSQESIENFIFNWKNLPNSEKALEKHLKWYLQTQVIESNICDLIRSDSVKTIITNKLLPGDLDQLAELLSRVVRGKCELEEALSHFNLRIRQQVESWFEQHSDFSQRIFFITLAILNGCKYKAVDDASQRLESLVRSLNEKEDTINPDPIFGRKRSSFLKDVCASLAQGFENTERGLSPVEVIKLDNSGFQPAILSFVWHEYNRLREPLLSLLHELGTDQSFDVRSRAAAAIGELSRYDFTAVLDKILRPWANSQDQRLQKLAALALSIPIFDSNLAPQVLGLLHNWSGLSNNLHLRWTATVAYGGYVGLRFPDAALRDLFTIAKSGNEFLFFAAAESITMLFQAGRVVSTQYLNVLDTIQVWTKEAKNKDEKTVSLLIFWLLLHKAKLREVSNNSYLPTILWLLWQEREWLKCNSETVPIYQKIIISLIKESLNLKKTRRLVLEELHRWLTLADYDCRLYPVLGSLLYNLIKRGSRHEKERVFEYLKRWASIESSNTASKIFSKLKMV